MVTKLKERDIARVVAEVTRLAEEREAEQRTSLERKEVMQILQNLNLPVELLDEAMVQLQQREVGVRQRRSRMLKISLAGVLVLILVLGLAFFIAQKNAELAAVSADQVRITRATDESNQVQSITANGEELLYRVNLQNAPLGKILDLSCNWRTPSGKVFRQNRWQTRQIDKTVWPTSCRCRIDQSAEKGEWTVDMLLDGRLLTSTTFKVE